MNFLKAKHEISKKTQLPMGALLRSSHIEINSNREVIVEGSKGVLDYDESLIKIDTGKMKIIFVGRSLSLKCLTADSLVIEGVIMSIEFMT